MHEKNEISYQQELIRKSIHMISLSIPVIYSFITREMGLLILIPLAIIFILIDIMSKRDNMIQQLINKFFGRMLRQHEKTNKIILNGATWVLISAVVCVFIFPKLITVTGFTILIISDMSAALFGRRFGKHGFFDKSLEGSAAFAVTAIICVFIIGFLSGMIWTYYLIGSIGAVVGAVVEAASIRLKMDDNLSIPVSIGIVMWIGDYVAGLYGLSYLAYYSIY